MTQKLLGLLASLFLCVSTVYGETLTVDFESGIPADWTSSGVTVKKDNGSNRAAMTSGATLQSPAIKGATQVSYKHRGSGSNKILEVTVSTDGGSTWNAIGQSSVSSSSTYGSSSFATMTSASDDCIIRFTAKSSTIYVDDIEINYVSLAETPTVQASLAMTALGGTNAAFDVIKGNGSGRIVAYTEGESLTWTPSNGVAYKAPFPRKVDNVTVIAAGDLSQVMAENLTPGVTYTFGVWEYNGDGDAISYLTEGMSPVKVTTPLVPVITAMPSMIDFCNTRVGGSKEVTLHVTAANLEPAAGVITISCTDGDVDFAIADGDYKSTIEISYQGGALAADVKVRFTPSDYTICDADVILAGGGAEAVIPVKGKGATADSREYYIAPDGNDEAAGTIDAPWLNLQKAVNAAAPGDIIYCRGGRYHFTTRDSSGKLTVRLKSSGTAESPITIRAYNDEQPIFDFEQQLLDCNRDRSKVGDRGMAITGNYWILYGLHITHAADNGIKLEGSHNRIERCEFSYNLDSGIQLGFGHDFSASGLGSHNDGSFCAYNDIIDCDSHHNCDYDANYGSDADGFACKMHNGIGNRFIRCRAWRNSDDAWDLYETDYSVVLIECWAWESGKAEDHTWVYDYFDKGPGFSGNGNGIKLGGNGSGGSSKGVHYAYNCIAFGNNKSGSTKGFDCNSHKDGHVVIGGLAFDNGYDFMFESGGGANSEFYNNVCFGRQEILVGTESHNALGGQTPNQGKTFFNNVVTQFSRSDYESLSEADALAPRGEDGSLPEKFGRLRSGSKLVDAGLHKQVPHTDEFPFLHQEVYGLSRDMGPYELKEGDVLTSVQMILTDKETSSFDVKQGRPGELLISIAVENPAVASVSLVNMNGVEVMHKSLGNLESKASYTIPVSTSGISSGIYLAVLNADGKSVARKVVVR